MVTFSLPNTTKYIQNFLQDYIFRILLHFAAKRCNSINLKVLFLAVVKDFALLT